MGRKYNPAGTRCYWYGLAVPCFWEGSCPGYIVRGAFKPHKDWKYGIVGYRSPLSESTREEFSLTYVGIGYLWEGFAQPQLKK